MEDADLRIRGPEKLEVYRLFWDDNDIILAEINVLLHLTSNHDAGDIHEDAFLTLRSRPNNSDMLFVRKLSKAPSPKDSLADGHIFSSR